MLAVISQAKSAPASPMLRHAPLIGDDSGVHRPISPSLFPMDRLGFAAAHLTNLEFGRDEEIIAQGCKAAFCYQVQSGCVRTVQLLEDGRRYIGAFLLAGDVFGWETGLTHDFAAESVTPVRLRRIRLSVLDEVADRDHGFATLLRHYAQAQLRFTQSRLILLGRKTAAERIASFLAEMQARLGTRTRLLELPMSRADMADYLGLTIETVCLGLSDLKRHGTIAVNRTRIQIQDPQALDRAGSDPVH